MRRISTIVGVGAITLLLGLPAGTAAQMPDTRDRTIMTFSAPVELPGMRLEAGTYVWKLADTPSRNVIQVFTQDEKEILGQWLFISAERREVTGETVVTFRETSAGSMPAVQYWFYPGESIGKEFIYPKDQATRIALRTGATVQSDGGPVTAEASAAAATESREGVGVVEGSGLPAEEPRPVATGGRADEPAESTQSSVSSSGSGVRATAQQKPSGDAQPESTTAQRFAGDELPQTGSPLALTSLLAALSLGGVVAFRRFRR
jgi:LPXTG-motif cell wall-anchored protein